MATTLKKNIRLYDYQERDLKKIFKVFHQYPCNYNLLYQLPTGGGKTIVFSEIVRRYIEETQKKVFVLTHRIELSKQTSNMLQEFDVKNKIINSEIKEFKDQDNYMCFVAMVETLNNRLQDKSLEINNIGLVIIDEAHYNSFRKLFGYFKNSLILGVTATPLSSNIKLPMKDSYEKLIVGETIPSLIEKKFLAKANIFSYNVTLKSLKVGVNGDYTVKSSEELFTSMDMQNKLLYAYEEISKGKKTLIFNNGINTSKFVCVMFKRMGYDIRHLDNTANAKERKEILYWFKHTPNAILTSVSILTTGFDEPSVKTIILNRATKSLTLYFQMIGRGSRILPNKEEFNVIDLGNNVERFGMWNTPINWTEIFNFPNFYYENLKSDEEIERNFKYVMPPELEAEFVNSKDISFDVKEVYKKIVSQGKKSKETLSISVEQHAHMCVDNAKDVFDARILAKKLEEEIAYRVKVYSYCIMKNSKNYIDWLEQDYMRKLRVRIGQIFSNKKIKDIED